MRDGSGYCGAHQADRRTGKFGDSRRGSRHERGYDSEWDKTRKRILERDKGLCQSCLKGSRLTVARQVDHIVSKAEAKARGWTREQTEADENLQAICKDCHDAKTAAEALRGRGR